MPNSTLNLVYDYWDGDKPISNGKILYPRHHFWDIEEFVISYINSFSNQSNKISIKNYKITDVYNNPNQRFFYFICHAHINIDELIKDNLIISNEIKNCLTSCKNFNLVFFSHHESDNESGFEMLNNLDLPKNQIYVINNNYKLDEYVKKHESEIKVYHVMYLPIIISLCVPNFGGSQFDYNRKEKFFMCFNRGPKIHRYSLILFMLKNNLLYDTNWSLIPNNFAKFDYEDYGKIFDASEIENYYNEIEILNNLKLKVSDNEKDELSFNEKNEITILNSNHSKFLSPPDFPFNYKNSYVNVVTETKFLDNENVIQISEKSFKPFFYYQFPMILATHHHIKSIKEKYNFDFFDDVIDHSYDNEPNQKKRFNLFVNEIKRLHDNKENLIEFYRNNKHRFERNKNKFIAIANNKSDYNFFKSLVD